MLKQFLYPLSFILCPLSILLPAQNIQFQGEQIEIIISDNQAQVIGTYYLFNPASFPVSRTLYYPFVVDQRLEYPDSISASLSPADHSLSYRPDSNGIFLSVPFLPEQSITLTVFYSQKTLSNQFEYILTTTREWHRPLQFADYLIQIPKDSEVTYLSLDYQEIKYQGNYKIYYIRRSDFMPSENLKIFWKEKKDETF
jgi:transglutaminase-like putative cysteine protease